MVDDGSAGLLQVEVAYAKPEEQVILQLAVRPGTTVGDVIEQSGILERFPEIDLTQQKVGVFSRIVGLDDAVREHDRVEIYRPLQVDPKEMRRRRARHSG